MTLPNKPRGTQDIYPPRSLIYYKVQQIITEILHKNNYQLIIFPTFEAKELFTSSLGSTTDIIHKEMYTFRDRKERELALRPEGTASVVRLVCQNNLVREGYPLKLYYWANMFRYERPQKGRYREFWQLGVELVNTQGVVADYQVLKLVVDILQNLGIKNFCFRLNYLGDIETKEKYKKELKKFIRENDLELCDVCQKRYEDNPLRILDRCSFCKEKYAFPPYKIAWNEKNINYVNELEVLLNKFKIPYEYDGYLVRGLDYYTGLVFEADLGSEKATLGGGRYDNLYQEIGDINVPAVGFAIGIERLVDYLEEKKLLKVSNEVDLFFLAIAPEAYSDILTWKEELAKYPLVVDYNLEVKKIKHLSNIIDYYQPKILIILGEKELKTRKILIKDCRKRQDFLVEKEKVVEWIINYLQS